MGDHPFMTHGLSLLNVKDKDDGIAQQHLSQSFSALQVGEQKGGEENQVQSLATLSIEDNNGSTTLHQVSRSLRELLANQDTANGSKHGTESMECTDSGGTRLERDYLKIALDGLLHSPRPGHPRHSRLIAMVDTNFLLAHLLWLCSLTLTEGEERISLVVPKAVAEEIHAIASDFECGLRFPCSVQFINLTTLFLYAFVWKRQQFCR